ncbi:hypothetical protein HYU12_01645, partial [Candidatus Woesearchaeota archaeon]|nr:hypothetical protein [Candidatus Woesearchaeota archaeon]
KLPDILAEAVAKELALAKDQALMNELNVEVCNVLLSRGVPAFPFQYSSGSVSSGRRIKSMNTALIRRMLNLGLVPVMFGTPSVDDRQGCSIISGDQIISFLSSKLNVSKVIFATNVDGVFDGDPRKDKAARILKSLSGKALARVNSGFSADIDVTGGMRGKIAEVLRMRGLKCQIINGSFRGNIKKALLGDEGIGTLITL